MAGHDGRQDYDMLEQPLDWDNLVMEEHAHEFKDGDVFDPNQELYRVSFLVIMFFGTGDCDRYIQHRP